MIYDIVHTTQYHFHRPVDLSWHELTFRPRDGHDLRVLATSLDVQPAQQQIDFKHDVYGNSVLRVLPGGPSRSLRIESRFRVDHTGARGFDVVDAHAVPGDASLQMPPRYSASERLALHAFLLPGEDDPDGLVLAWAQGFLDGNTARGPRAVVTRMTASIAGQMRYRVRPEEGVQIPLQTLALQAGACRDFATLMIDALRRLGIAARFVSGYLYSVPAAGQRGAGTTHAWVQCYLPECGWIACDPTNNLVGGSELIPIAVARQASEVSPLSGAWFGDAEDFAGMVVDVQVTAVGPVQR